MFVETELSESNKISHILKSQDFWDNFFLVASCILAGWSLVIWYLLNWEYLPDWLPLPGFPLMDFFACFGPLLFCITGLPALLGFIVGIVGNVVLLINRMLSWQIAKALKLGVGLTVLGIATLPWMFQGTIEDRALDHAIERYDVVINAIETYRTDYGHYPANLEDLVPSYLPEIPGKYMKFGEMLIYEPHPSAWYDHAPFTFELYGHYYGIHGQTLKYCPVETNPCYEGARKITPSRINDRWIWVYSSAL
jgi:hypothetical protein